MVCVRPRGIRFRGWHDSLDHATSDRSPIRDADESLAERDVHCRRSRRHELAAFFLAGPLSELQNRSNSCMFQRTAQFLLRGCSTRVYLRSLAAVTSDRGWCRSHQLMDPALDEPLVRAAAVVIALNVELQVPHRQVRDDFELHFPQLRPRARDLRGIEHAPSWRSFHRTSGQLHHLST